MMVSAIPTETDGEPAARSRGVPERRCIVTRRTAERDQMIRFAVSPGGDVVPDPAERLPGRGLWLTARGDIVQRACEERSFSKAARRNVNVPADLLDRLTSLLDKRCLELIGLARRSGEAVAGFEKVMAAARAGDAAVLLEASDGSGDGRGKIERAAAGAGMITLWTAEQLGGPFARDKVVHAAIKHGGLCDRLVREARRLEGLRNPDAAPRIQAQLQES